MSYDAHVHRLMTEAVQQGIFPGAVLLAARNGIVRFARPYGVCSLFAGPVVTLDTVFDLASLTKPLGTTLAVMKLVQSARLLTGTHLGHILPEFAGTDKAHITVEQLLTHCSGLPAWQPYYLHLRHLPLDCRKPALRSLLVREPLASPPGTQMVYSDLGFMTLEWVVESVAGVRMDRFLAREIYGPTGLGDILFFPDAAHCHRVFAATEQCPWRRRILNGEVHDDNAWAAGGIGGHAGLFGTADGVFRLAFELMNLFQGQPGTGVFCSDTVRYFMTPYRDIGRTPGFDRPLATGASCGKYFSQNTVGHLGFTGTSFWMDLDRSLIVVLLTNRVHPVRENIRIREFRPLIHDAVMKLLITEEDSR